MLVGLPKLLSTNDSASSDIIDFGWLLEIAQGAIDNKIQCVAKAALQLGNCLCRRFTAAIGAGGDQRAPECPT